MFHSCSWIFGNCSQAEMKRFKLCLKSVRNISGFVFLFSFLQLCSLHPWREPGEPVGTLDSPLCSCHLTSPWCLPCGPAGGLTAPAQVWWRAGHLRHSGLVSLCTEGHLCPTAQGSLMWADGLDRNYRLLVLGACGSRKEALFFISRLKHLNCKIVLLLRFKLVFRCLYFFYN